MKQAAERQAELERITILSSEFTPAAMEFHRRRMGQRGYAIDGPIVRQRPYRVEGHGTPAPVLGGEEMFAVTFVRAKS